MSRYNAPRISRRMVLRGVGTVAVGLPMLDIFARQSPAYARAEASKVYSAFMLQQNGAIQGHGREPDMFWPRKFGAIDPEAMRGSDADRTTSELVDYAADLNFIRRLDFRYSNNHDGGPVAAGAAAPVRGSGTKQLPVSGSADDVIARAMTPGIEPLNVYAGRKGTFRDDAYAFREDGSLRIADNNPWNVFERLMGLDGLDPKQAELIQKRRLSVNDLVRDEMRELLGRADLSAEDRRRLDLHFTSIRELETDTDAVVGPKLDEAALKAIDGEHTENGNMEAVVRLQLELIAFAFASDRVRTATLQVGGCNDHTRYTIDGKEQPPFHYISHRIMSDGGSGDAIPNAIELHHQIDRIHARYFKHLLDRLSAYTLPDGRTLLDASVNLWCNSVSDGPPHSGKDVPHVLAGNAGGFLKTGQHIEAKGYNSSLLSTIISASGVRKANGDLVDDFGDPDSKGLVDAIIT